MNIHLPAIAALLAIAASGPALANETWVYVNNESDLAIMTVRISHIDTPQRGPDLLGASVIPAGSFAKVAPQNPEGYCRFNVEVAYENGQKVALWDLNLCELVDIYVSDSGATRVAY